MHYHVYKGISTLGSLEIFQNLILSCNNMYKTPEYPTPLETIQNLILSCIIM